MAGLAAQELLELHEVLCEFENMLYHEECETCKLNMDEHISNKPNLPNMINMNNY